MCTVLKRVVSLFTLLHVSLCRSVCERVCVCVSEAGIQIFLSLGVHLTRRTIGHLDTHLTHYFLCDVKLIADIWGVGGLGGSVSSLGWCV